MSNETTNPVVKWILIGIIVVSLCVVGAFVLLGTKPVKELRAAAELEKRGFEIRYIREGYNIWQYPVDVWGSDLSITDDDSRLLCQLPHLQLLSFQRCDLSGLNLDDIGNCQELILFQCQEVTQLPADEIRKLMACPLQCLMLNNACLNDSDLADFAKLIKLFSLSLDENVGITDAAFEHLEKMTSLRQLYLMGTSVTWEGVEDFRKKRPDVYSLTVSLTSPDDVVF